MDAGLSSLTADQAEMDRDPTLASRSISSYGTIEPEALETVAIT